MNVERMLAVIDAVERTPESHFDMQVWKDERDCGTAGCAIGSYCNLNPDSELKIHEDGHGYIAPHFNGEDNFAAVAAFLGIRFVDASDLFDPDSYGTRRVKRETVLARLRTFVAENR